MKAMILAAGRGERMRPLTDKPPKPLLPVNGKPMIEYTIEALVIAGFNEIVINLAHLGEKVKNALGDGARLSASIRYSDEGENGLETAGGIIHALPLLGEQPFLVVNGDIASDFPFTRLFNKAIDLAHLVLVDNPAHHAEGDFGLQGGQVLVHAQKQYTFSGIGIYRPELFADVAPGKSRLAPLLRKAMANNRVSGEYHAQFWMDIGTPQRLIELENHYQSTRKQYV
jgi:MurNAc alpha-1-phosphate uridylyltransferase